MKSIFFAFVLFFALDASEVKVVAFAQDDMSNDFRKAQVLEAKREADKHKNLKFVFSDAKGRTSLLVYQIGEFAKQKVDLIIVGTNDADAVARVVERAYASGVAVIVLDRGINSQKYSTFINSDNVKIGAIGARYVAQKLNYKGVALLFEGLLSADVTKLRSKGFLDEMAKYEDIRIIKRTGNYLRRDAIKEMDELLREGVEIDAIFAQSDSMISGARSAMRRYKKDPSSIIMVGCDYTSEARKAILEGSQTASVKFPLGGKQAIEQALKIFAGEKPPKHIFIPVELVDKDNANAVEPIF